MQIQHVSIIQNFKAKKSFVQQKASYESKIAEMEEKDRKLSRELMRAAEEAKIAEMKYFIARNARTEQKAKLRVIKEQIRENKNNLETAKIVYERFINKYGNNEEE